MATDRDYLEYIMENLPEGASFRPMMGEYIIYYGSKVVGGIYDNRFLIKPTASAVSLMPDAVRELPYDGAKPMLLVSDTDSRNFLKKLLESVSAELPRTKK